MLTQTPCFPSENLVGGSLLPRSRCIKIQLIVIMYEAMSAEMKIERRILSASLLPMLRRRIIIGITREKRTELRGISCGRWLCRSQPSYGPGPWLYVPERRSGKMAPHHYERKPRVVGMQQREKKSRLQLQQVIECRS
jgi:hypothetical protein